MGLVILPALIPDIRAIYDVYFSAFKGEPMAELMLGVLFPGGINEEFQAEHAKHTLAYWHYSSQQHTIKCVDAETGEIIGMALGDAYFKERTVEERANPGIPWLEGKEKERAESILNPLWDVREKLFGGHRYICGFPSFFSLPCFVLYQIEYSPSWKYLANNIVADVHVAAVDPKHQGRKAGALLVQWGIDLGENGCLPVYFESSPSTVKLYQKMGFERLNESVIHKAEVLGTTSDIEVPLMVKMPSCAGGMTFDEWRTAGYPDLKRKQNICT